MTVGFLRTVTTAPSCKWVCPCGHTPPLFRMRFAWCWLWLSWFQSTLALLHETKSGIMTSLAHTCLYALVLAIFPLQCTFSVFARVTNVMHHSSIVVPSRICLRGTWLQPPSLEMLGYSLATCFEGFCRH